MNETQQPAVAGPVEPTVRQHTPGPWHVANGVQIRSQRDQIAKVWMMRDGEGNANAALIAAAPDMLNALRSLLRHAERVNEVLEQECGVRFVDTGPLDMARDALKRAVGAA